MQQDENAVIRYMMKEMDPSEEVLMERAMMEDDDLLIEVESMRQTLHRLDDLPEKEPPADLTESIVQQAAEQKKTTSQWPSVPSQVYKYAAVLLVGMGLGSGLLLFLNSAETGETAGNNAAITSQIGTPATDQQANDTEPWVDRDDVVYFQDMFNQQSPAYNNIMQASMDKLTPVNDNSLRGNSTTRGLQLTGSSN